MHPCGFRSIMPYSQGRDGASDTAHFKASASFGLERKTGVYPFRTSKYQSLSLVSSHLCNHRVSCSYRCIHINFNCPWRWQRPRNMPNSQGQSAQLLFLPLANTILRDSRSGSTPSKITLFLTCQICWMSLCNGNLPFKN